MLAVQVRLRVSCADLPLFCLAARRYYVARSIAYCVTQATSKQHWPVGQPTLPETQTPRGSLANSAAYLMPLRPEVSQSPEGPPLELELEVLDPLELELELDELEELVPLSTLPLDEEDDDDVPLSFVPDPESVPEEPPS